MEGLADPKVTPLLLPHPPPHFKYFINFSVFFARCYVCFERARFKLPTLPPLSPLLLLSPIALHQHAAQLAAAVCRSPISMCGL